MLGLWKWWPETRSIWLLLTLALIVRIGAIFQFPNGDDIHRYIWEGEIQQEGFNPFQYAPKAPELNHLRNENWKGINHKKIPTIYWPFSQLMFKSLIKISSSTYLFKTAFVLFDIGIILILLLLCTQFAIPKKYIILYALNPFTIVFTAGGGHLEVVMVFWLILSIFFLKIKRFRFMYLSLGMAIMTKITPIMLLPFFIQRKNIRYIFMLFIPFLLVHPYLQNDVSLLTVPLHFLEKFRYNGLVYSFVRLFFDKQISLYYCVVILIICYTVIFFVTPDPIKAVSLAIGTFLICTPAFHPWYLLMMTPFLVLYRSPPWITLHLTILPLVFVFNRAAPYPFWRNKILMMYIEYIPFVIVSIWYLLKGTQHWPIRYSSQKNISVIIPVYNEEKNIAECIGSIQNQSVDAEIIVVDGGSHDNTQKVVQSFKKVKLLYSLTGRGTQIAHGIKHANGDVIIIIHADSRLKEHAFSRFIHALEKNAEVSGGAFGAVYEDKNRRFQFAELLNNLRTKLFGISFGDQAQFFRKEALRDYFPAYKLMEDIELSLRMKEKGSVIFLPDGVLSSTRTWKKAGYINNFLKVILLSSFYILRRKFSLLTKDCSDFYRLYYGKN